MSDKNFLKPVVNANKTHKIGAYRAGNAMHCDQENQIINVV
jgi:hypothetical protein